MKHVLFQRANYILGSLAFICGLGMYGIQNAIVSGLIPMPSDLLWIVFIVTLGLDGLISGKAISRLHYWAYRDFLTNTWNRKYFISRLHGELCAKQQTG